MVVGTEEEIFVDLWITTIKSIHMSYINHYQLDIYSWLTANIVSLCDSVYNNTLSAITKTSRNTTFEIYRNCNRTATSKVEIVMQVRYPRGFFSLACFLCFASSNLIDK